MEKMKSFKIVLISIPLINSGGAGFIQGTVMPYENGQYQAISIGENKAAALKIADKDATVTCKKEGEKKYVVSSQDVIHTPPPEIKTGNDFIDAIGKIAAYSESKEASDDYEATTIFKCR